MLGYRERDRIAVVAFINAQELPASNLVISAYSAFP
jgi:hypothetical protein